jgi:hypothetical protein
MAEFNQASAIAQYTPLAQRIRVGAYQERDVDGSYAPDGIEETIDRLDMQAAENGLKFVWDGTVFLLEPMTPEEKAEFEAAQQREGEEPPDVVVEQLHRVESPGYNALGEDEPYYVAPDEEDDN